MTEANNCPKNKNKFLKNDDYLFDDEKIICASCDGEGVVDDDELCFQISCRACGGAGVLVVKKMKRE